MLFDLLMARPPSTNMDKAELDREVVHLLTPKQMIRWPGDTDGDDPLNDFVRVIS